MIKTMGRDHNEASESVSSIGDCSSDSAGSSSLSSELVEDASSSSLSFGCSSSSSTSSGCLSSSSTPDNGDPGPIFELSKLMDNLPIKRGLSKFYDGKSQSNTSLSSVMSLDDLAKAERPCQKRLKLSRSFLQDLADAQHINSRLSIPKCAKSVNTSGSHVFMSRFSKRPKKGKRCRPMSSLSLHHAQS